MLFITRRRLKLAEVFAKAVCFAATSSGVLVMLVCCHEVGPERNKKKRTRSAHPASRPLPFRSLQELRRHLNCCFQLFFFTTSWCPRASPLQSFLRMSFQRAHASSRAFLFASTLSPGSSPARIKPCPAPS